MQIAENALPQDSDVQLYQDFAVEAAQLKTQKKPIDKKVFAKALPGKTGRTPEVIHKIFQFNRVFLEAQLKKKTVPTTFTSITAEMLKSNQLPFPDQALKQRIVLLADKAGVSLNASEIETIGKASGMGKKKIKCPLVPPPAQPTVLPAFVAAKVPIPSKVMNDPALVVLRGRVLNRFQPYAKRGGTQFYNLRNLKVKGPK